ncbi:DUF4382 domain-containing protein [Adhaeribacter aquaticus]|uniref:DUF4382 domain-containing protein n=1 Tax=Adhaeribacter aquaticus TaxID=299567 RepID=UPI00040235ED|nr:DUF4382 domain-containing protein [Adhaeribacter aquaticus]
MKLKFLVPFAFAALLGFTSCDNSKDNNGSAKLNIHLTDAPGDYAAVNVDVVGVEIHNENQDNGTGWQTLNMVNRGIINLLNLSNGRNMLLASAELPAGKIGQIRLKLGNNNTLVLRNGQTVNLNTPSGQSSGLKLQVNQELKPDVTYEILLDFDAAKSIVKRGNSGQYNLKPVIRTITTAVKGGIRGKINPAAARPGILVLTAANDTIAGGFSDATTGDFLLKGISAGTYTVEFSSVAPYKLKDTRTVVVTNEDITDVGIVNLN